MAIKAIVCDVNETLFTIEAFRPRLKAAGLTQDKALEVCHGSAQDEYKLLMVMGGLYAFQ